MPTPARSDRSAPLTRDGSPAAGAAPRGPGSAYTVNALIGSFPHGAVVVFDHDLRYLRAGGAGLADVGLSPEMLEGRTIFEAYPAETAAFIEPSYRQALAGVGSITDTPFQGRVYEVRLAPVWDGGTVIAGVGYTQDVTDARAAELAVRESEEQFRMSFRHAPIGMAIVGLDGRFVQVNDALCAITGYTSDELVALSFPDITHPEDLEADNALVARLLTGELTHYQLAKRYLHAGGAAVWVALSVSIVRSDDGTPRHLIAQVQDVNDRVLAQQEQARSDQELAEVHAFQAAVLAASPDAISLMDVATYTNVWASRSVVELLGYSEGELARLGRDLLPRLIPAPDLDRFRAAVDAAADLSDGQRLDLRHRVLHADGAVRWFLRRMTPFRRHPDGSVEQILAVSTEITAQVHAEERLADSARQLAAARDAAVAADLAKSSFLAATSHEIRTPLNGLLGMTGLLQQTDLDDRQRDFVGTAQACGEHLLALLTDVLDFSKADAGHLEIERHEVDLAALVDQAVVIVAETARAKGLAVRGGLAPSVPRLVSGDGLRLRQALLNLLSNAVKFTATGRVDATVSCTAGGLVRFEVTDTGPGVDPATVDTLFDPFRQADAGTSRRYGGTGLGLAITRQIAELHGGGVGAHARPQGGSAFWFTAELPALAGRQADHTAPPITPGIAAAGSLSGRVLLAEDNRVNQLVARLLLERFGLSVDVVDNGRKALDAALAVDYDLVLMDRQMPEMDGLEAVRALRSAGCHVPVLALTAASSRQDELECSAAGMDGYLTKPIDAGVLDAALRRHLPAAGTRARTAVTRSAGG